MAVQAITIGTAEGIDEIRERLDDEFRYLQEEGVTIRVGQTTRGRYAFLDCALIPAAGTPLRAEALVRHGVANALSDVIVEKWEKRLIRKIIRATYHYFSPDEQEIILHYSDRNLAGAAEEPGQDRPYRTARKCEILHRLRDYLDGADQLVVEGFLAFRLRDYVEEVEDAVDRAVDDFLMEREYREFVRLLKYFVDLQEPRIAHVHVLIKGGGTFRLMDEEGSAIRSEYLEEFVADMVESEVNYEDLLISALITLAPRHVTVHREPSAPCEEVVETIQAVFTERVTLCASPCGFCTAALLPRSGDSGHVLGRH